MESRNAEINKLKKSLAKQESVSKKELKLVEKLKKDKKFYKDAFEQLEAKKSELKMKHKNEIFIFQQ